MDIVQRKNKTKFIIIISLFKTPHPLRRKALLNNVPSKDIKSFLLMF